MEARFDSIIEIIHGLAISICLFQVDILAFPNLTFNPLFESVIDDQGARNTTYGLGQRIVSLRHFLNDRRLQYTCWAGHFLQLQGIDV